VPLNTRADLLKYAIAHALADAYRIVRGVPVLLTKSEREKIGEHVATSIADLPDDPWQLKKELPREWSVASGGNIMPKGWCPK
jgi:hypothetical protein